jgi:hypothetical protein
VSTAAPPPEAFAARDRAGELLGPGPILMLVRLFMFGPNKRPEGEVVFVYPSRTRLDLDFAGMMKGDPRPRRTLNSWLQALDTAGLAVASTGQTLTGETVTGWSLAPAGRRFVAGALDLEEQIGDDDADPGQDSARVRQKSAQAGQDSAGQDSAGQDSAPSQAESCPSQAESCPSTFNDLVDLVEERRAPPPTDDELGLGKRAPDQLPDALDRALRRTPLALYVDSSVWRKALNESMDSEGWTAEQVLEMVAKYCAAWDRLGADRSSAIARGTFPRREEIFYRKHRRRLFAEYGTPLTVTLSGDDDDDVDTGLGNYVQRQLGQIGGGAK